MMIQQLVDYVGILKGVVYFYFWLKVDVMIFLMCSFEEDVFECVQEIVVSDELSFREWFCEQLCLQFEEVCEQCLFFEIYMKDFGVVIDEELVFFVQKFCVEWQLLQEDFVCQVFFIVDEGFVIDVVVCLSGVFNEYYFYVFFEVVEVDFDVVVDLFVVQVGVFVEVFVKILFVLVFDCVQLCGKEEIDEVFESVVQVCIDVVLEQIEV